MFTSFAVLRKSFSETAQKPSYQKTRSSGVKRPGELLQLTCTGSGFSLTNYGVQWIHQPSGKGLEWIGGIWNNGAAYYSSALKNRVTITRDTSKNQVFLQLTGLKPEDTATYYCVKYTVRKPFAEAAQKLLFQETSH
uniref:Ig-like domain-containing protein n=1 Tax=Varanus komodoensis TaxID=61221 RepID=A0A8D2LCP6_VARKO